MSEIEERGGKVKVSKAARSKLPADRKPRVGGKFPSPDVFRARATGKRFVLTCAQNNTRVHTGFLAALELFCKDKGAQLMVSRFSYNKAGWGNQQLTKNSKSNVQGEDLWYDERIVKYTQDDDIKLADGLVFSANLDILPTAKDPLQGLDNYTGTNSMVVPHAKVHLRSYAGLYSGQPLRFGYTTGACTARNYIERRAGQIASYHHVYGALYVEVDEAGVWFARQLIADDTGSFFDLNDYYIGREQGVLGHERVINLGDIHAEKMDPAAFKVAMDMVRYSNPSHIAVHDLLDFEARNHHNLKDPFFIANQHFNGMNTVEANFAHAVMTLESIAQNAPLAKLLLIRSNHDEAFHRWLREFDAKHDPANARFYHYHMYRKFLAIEQNDQEYDAYVEALVEAAREINADTNNWIHIKEDDSYVLHEIEYGLHGHLGPNGSKGSPKSYRQLGRKLNTGHTHSASIIDGVWTAGVLSSLHMGYNKGPSSWSHSHIITHPNGKRQMITQKGDKWRA